MIDIFLFLLGAVCGSFANWAIYQLGYFRARPISPLGPRHPDASPRVWTDRIPIIGWWFLRRDAGIHGSGFWIRPLLIELVLAVGFVWLYHWQTDGGLLGMQTAPRGWDGDVWFAGHVLLFWLLVVATFIDFDEKTIPDWITVPGVLAALTLSVWTPPFRLPEVFVELGGANYRPLHFYSPGDISHLEWHRDWRGLLTAGLIVAVWVYALLPKTFYWQRGVWYGLRLQYVSVFRSRRATVAGRRPRTMFGLTRALLGLGVLLILASIAIHAVGGERWESFLGALLGLAYTGGIVWAVRIIASLSMGQEALGFGDVTLAAMIGSFVGWQAGLLVFATAPFAALVIAIIQFVFTRNREIAFGPYLALAALFLVLGWYWIWDWARVSVFGLGGWLHVILAVCLVALGVMLFAIRWQRGVTP